MKVSDAPPKKIGRPREFDRDAALDAAMRAFWEHGYETTSIADLCDSMGINAPALYNAFGNKEALFREALALYRGDPQILADAVLNAPNSQSAARLMLEGAIERFSGTGTPSGCLIATSLATGSAASAGLRAEAKRIREESEALICERIEADIAAGTLPRETDAATLAALVITVIQGLSVMARDGMDRASLQNVADTAIRVWPTAPRAKTPTD